MPSNPSAFHDRLGRVARLQIQRFGKQGAFLVEPKGGQDAPSLLLLGPEIPEGAREGDELSVFVYLDSQDRPLATTQVPKVSLGQVAFLRVTSITRFGAFVDWGLPKELLVPFSEQTVELDVGVRQPIGLYLDRTGRLAGTMRVAEMLNQRPHHFEPEEWLSGEAWRYQSEIGLFVIVERAFTGLVPQEEPHSLVKGEAARFRVTHVLPDGKLELSLRRHAHEELAGDAQRILERLRGPRAVSVSDRTSPEEIRELFGLSKKAFKRAIGRLLKERAVQLDADGYVRLAR